LFLQRAEETKQQKETTPSGNCLHKTSDNPAGTPTEGSPQGAVISPLLANIYLHPLDELMASHGCKMARYADDCVP